jgi:hypothetical protein
MSALQKRATYCSSFDLRKRADQHLCDLLRAATYDLPPLAIRPGLVNLTVSDKK